MGRWIAGAVVTIIGLPLVIEAGASFLADGAFPHVNFYVPDEKLGVRLEPYATERISFGGNPVTSVRTNGLGFRGADWEAATGPEVLMVGDSQVFGLGVEESETAAAVLGTLIERPVRNAGVPTYGPPEYLAVIDEQLSLRPFRDVVLVFNASNDFFELDRPNVERHAVWDGWAVRADNEPIAVTEFPGRRWIYQHSHAFFAWRRSQVATLASEASLPSEGTALDLVPLARQRVQGTAAEEEARQAAEAELVAAGAKAATRMGKGEAESTLLFLLEYHGGVSPGSEAVLGLEAMRAGSRVGDIVFASFAESARGTPLTAEMLEAGAKLRRELPGRAEEVLRRTTDPKLAERLRDALDAFRGRTGEEASGQVASANQPISLLHDVIVAAHRICEQHGAALTVVMLPLDVQVSDTEWAKYGQEPTPLDESRALNEEVIRDAAAMGIRVVDPRVALRDAEPGAFLLADLHLSPKGQAVLASEIGKALGGTPPVPWPAPGLQPGRSRVPLVEEWARADELDLTGGRSLGCEARRVREWVRVTCRPTGGAITGIRVVEAPLETWVRLQPGARADVLVPLIPEHGAAVDLHVGEAAWRVRVNLTETSLAPVAEALPADVTADVAPVVDSDGTAHPLSVDWIGELDEGCRRSEWTAEEALGCADGRRLALPTCGMGEVNAGSSGHCYALCSDARPCAEGRCLEWMGSAVCL